MALIERLPIWLIGLVMMIALAGLHELGFQCGRRIERDKESGDGKGHLVGAALALLGLMTAFTFGAAQDRFNMRQRMVVEEANALGTTYLRIQTLDLPARDILSRQMLRYAQVRQDFFVASANPASLEENTKRTGELQDEMWPVLISAVRTNPIPTLNVSLLQTTNDMFDLAASRRAGIDARVPVSILRMLTVYALSAAAIMGFAGAKERRYSVVSTAVLLLLTLAFCLILDLDRPSAGTIRINQSAMTRAVEEIRRSEVTRVASGQTGDAPAGSQLPHR
jgi:hypothetical protein